MIVRLCDICSEPAHDASKDAVLAPVPALGGNIYVTVSYSSKKDGIGSRGDLCVSCKRKALAELRTAIERLLQSKT